MTRTSRRHLTAETRTIQEQKRYVRLCVTLAIKAGKLLRPKHCELCRRADDVEAHHDDYGKPMSVRWLCCWCHDDQHTKRPTYRGFTIAHRALPLPADKEGARQ